MTELDTPMDAVESQLQALAEALRGQRAEDIEATAATLQRALAVALPPLRRSAHGAALPPALYRRLEHARGQVAAQRESLARAGAALGRSMDVLLPHPAARAAYSAAGLNERQAHSGLVRA